MAETKMASLDEVKTNPACVASMPLEQALVLWPAAEQVVAALRTRVLAGSLERLANEPPAEREEWISVKEAARRLGVSPVTIYRNWGDHLSQLARISVHATAGRQRPHAAMQRVGARDVPAEEGAVTYLGDAAGISLLVCTGRTRISLREASTLTGRAPFFDAWER